jgi:anti-sigma regulatory factor (Ser/Thr protein kinase)
MSPDAITLSFPAKRPFHGVARLVVGGLAARLDLTYEHLEDLQLALASVLERADYAASGEVTVELVVNPESVGMVIGPLNEDRVRADLAPDSGDGISLRRLLSTLVGSLELEHRDGGAWLRLDKRVPLKQPKER